MINLIKLIPSKYWLGLSIVLLVCLAFGLSIWKASSIDARMDEAQRQIDEANTRLKTAYDIIDKMHTEHDTALEAANTALKERMEIYEAARDRICEAEKRIHGNSNFCDQLVPDDIVRLWKEQDAARISKNPVSAAD